MYCFLFKTNLNRSFHQPLMSDLIAKHSYGGMGYVDNPSPHVGERRRQ